MRPGPDPPANAGPTARSSLRDIALVFLKLGAVAFGGPAAHIAMMEDEVVRRRRWLSREAFLDYLGATNLIPGPNSTELAIHIGQARGGWRGLVIAGASFILPAATIVTVNLGNVQMFLERGTPAPGGCSVYFVVGNADELFEFQRANGVEVVEPPGDRPYGLRDYRVRDLHGYELGFGHHLFNTGPPIEIERVDVPLRLERRLAALLHDLAAFKRMSLDSCLEETLLHTLEGVGPHTKTDLRHIEALKRKHGIDYDSHASYRFVERRPG